MPGRTDRGTGLVATVAGVLVFVGLVSFAAQLLVSLHARSVISSVAFDAARSVATSTDEAGNAEPVDVSTAERTARRLLGRVGAQASFSWEIDREQVRLHVRAPVPRLSVLPLPGLVELREVDRTVAVRAERVR